MYCNRGFDIDLMTLILFDDNECKNGHDVAIDYSRGLLNTIIRK